MLLQTAMPQAAQVSTATARAAQNQTTRQAMWRAVHTSKAWLRTMLGRTVALVVVERMVLGRTVALVVVERMVLGRTVALVVVGWWASGMRLIRM